MTKRDHLEEHYINDSEIDDISFCELLPQLKKLNCETMRQHILHH